MDNTGLELEANSDGQYRVGTGGQWRWPITASAVRATIRDMRIGSLAVLVWVHSH